MASAGPGSSKDQPAAKRSGLKRTDSSSSGKSILRTHKGGTKSSLQLAPDAAVKWNEENVKKTLHPKDKDYGMMKVAEPKTPYSYDMTKEQSTVDAQVLAQRIEMCRNETLKAARIKREDEENMTEAQKEHVHEFEKKRKMHYNEFQAAKEARERMKKEEEEEEEAQRTTTTTTTTKPNQPVAKSAEQAKKK
ncbi:protein phosphatase inhibitor 2-like [Dermacentor albipictus]|uniref:protein phosphatase inhibitor 2-like n=1 Tax=Dermacentor albipictus TaxID=60249 RepID=UPI0031FD48EB